MSQDYQRIGDFIDMVDNRNSGGNITKLTGISIDKCYIPSVANVIGTDLRNYKTIYKGQFACSLMQVSRDQRIPIAMYSSDEPAIMSPAYVIFEVVDTDKILPEYMDLWFRRSEFDREASFYAVGGVRGSLDWDDFCNMKLPVPSLLEQKRIVSDYYVVTSRIALLKRINDNLEQIAQTDFNNMFISFSDDLSLVDTKLGMLPNHLPVKSFRDISVRVENGSRPSGGACDSGFPSLGADCAKGLGCYDESKAKYVPESYAQNMKRGIVKGYELLLYKDGGTPSNFVPDFSIYGEGYPFETFAINEHVFIVDFGSPASNWFAYFLFKSKYVYGELAALGGKSAIPGISQSDLEELYLIDPACPKAIEFGDKCIPLLKTILINCKEILALKRLQQQLLITIAKGA